MIYINIYIYTKYFKICFLINEPSHRQSGVNSFIYPDCLVLGNNKSIEGKEIYTLDFPAPLMTTEKNPFYFPHFPPIYCELMTCVNFLRGNLKSVVRLPGQETNMPDSPQSCPAGDIDHPSSKLRPSTIYTRTLVQYHASTFEKSLNQSCVCKTVHSQIKVYDPCHFGDVAET